MIEALYISSTTMNPNEKMPGEAGLHVEEIAKHIKNLPQNIRELKLPELENLESAIAAYAESEDKTAAQAEIRDKFEVFNKALKNSLKVMEDKISKKPY